MRQGTSVFRFRESCSGPFALVYKLKEIGIPAFLPYPGKGKDSPLLRRADGTISARGVGNGEKSHSRLDFSSSCNILNT